MTFEDGNPEGGGAPAPSDVSRNRGDLGWGDYVVPGFIFLFCAVVAYISTTFEEALPLIVGHSMQPRAFPIFLMAVIAVLNVVLLSQILKKPISRRNWEPYQTWVSGILFGVFYFLTEHLDILIALAAVMFTLAVVWGERRIWVAAVLALGTTAAIFFSFDLVLEVRFPRGILTDWYYG